ncbi:hypothetical protein [Moraxella oblonga]|uniref:hypothetical protein n=1 Tax=Moraxella oblonga TaxID=200413 RepID=UPI00083642FB|nr:hypothetical protein [Moraxella oblonga]
MKLPKKKGWLKFFALIVALTAISIIMSLDLIFALPLMVLTLILYYFDKSTPQRQSKIKIISYLILLFFVIFGKSLVGSIFKDNTEQVCGILIKNDFEFFNRFILNKPNILIQKYNQILEFRFITNIPLNSKVCVNYVESDDSIWFYNDYVLDIQEIKN